MYFERVEDFLGQFNPGDRLNYEFLLKFSKDRINVKFYPYETNPTPATDFEIQPRFFTSFLAGYIGFNNLTFGHWSKCYHCNSLSKFCQESHVSLSGVIDVFNPQVWILICLFMALFNSRRPLSFLQHRFSKRRNFSMKYLPSVVFKSDVIEKILLCSWALTRFLLMEIFKANMSAKLTVDLDCNIYTLEDILKHPEFHINELSPRFPAGYYIKNNKPDLYREIEKRRERYPLKEGQKIEDVLLEGRGVIIETTHHLEYVCRNGNPNKIRLHYGRELFGMLCQGTMISTSISPTLKRLINQRSLRYWETGHEIRSFYLLNGNTCSNYIYKEQSLQFSSSTLRDLSLVFLIYTISNFICLLLSLAEFAYGAVAKNRK